MITYDCPYNANRGEGQSEKKTLKHTITYVHDEALLNSTFISPVGTISSQQISQVRL